MPRLLLTLSAALALLASATLGSSAQSVQTFSTPYSAPIVLRPANSSVSYTPHFASFNGNRDGHHFQILVTMANGQPAPAETFKFVGVSSKQAATSALTGCLGPSATGETNCFGMLQSTRNSKYCVVASGLQAYNARFVAAPCSYTDDASQLRQLWRLRSYPATWDGTEALDYATELIFLGRAKGTTTNGRYLLSPGNTDNVKVQLDWDTAGRSNSYRMFMSPTTTGYYPELDCPAS